MGLRFSLYCLIAYFDELAGEGVFEFGGDEGQAVEKEHHVDAVIIFLAVFELAHQAEAVLPVKRPMVGVHLVGGAAVVELELDAARFDAAAQHIPGCRVY